MAPAREPKWICVKVLQSTLATKSAASIRRVDEGELLEVLDGPKEARPAMPQGEPEPEPAVVLRASTQKLVFLEYEQELGKTKQ